MTHSDQRFARLCRFASWLFVIAAVLLWVPLSWEGNFGDPTKHIDVEFGALEPLQATWDSSPNGFWFRFSELRVASFILSIVLTAAAIIAARHTAQLSRQESESPTPVAS